MPTNTEFLTALFGTSAQFAHVTDFVYDPGGIPHGKHLPAWKGDYFGNYHFHDVSNQYFTISTFDADEFGIARRRKALYKNTPVIVLDDVREKLSMTEVNKLPPPAWILETSPGSEQWGYILDTPCTDRGRVENLLDGLVANGLAPEGRDPGMKGVTRYVRLPDGHNNKASKLVNGHAFKCRIVLWEPTRRVTLEQLAAPFVVNLDTPRRDSRVDGAGIVDNHPLLHIPDLLHIKEVRSDGRFDVTCPWVEEHTGADDSGAAIFTNTDGSLGFKCHHGACQSRTGRHLLQYIDNLSLGFTTRLSSWQVTRSFEMIANKPVTTMAPPPLIDFMGGPAPVVVPVIDPVPAPAVELSIDDHINQLRFKPLGSEDANNSASVILKAVESLPEINKIQHHKNICDIMRWSKTEFTAILKDLRGRWYDAKATSDINFFDDTVYISDVNHFYSNKKDIFLSPEAYQNTYAHLDPEARKEALQNGRVNKVDKLDFAPLRPAVFVEDGITYANSWTNCNEQVGTRGDASPWLNHFDKLGWGEHRKHVLQWMAYTIRQPDVKINHILLLGSCEGTGKDWLLHPLMMAMKGNQTTISGEELLEGFNDYILKTKYLHINETELGDRKEAQAVSNRLKPLAAAPPDTLRCNQKGLKKIKVRNILNATMTTNSQMPIQLNGPSRRFFALWTDVDPRDPVTLEMLPEWVDYWNRHWEWMLGGGAEIVIDYLRTQVDLSDFNPGTAPPVTQFLRDITDASKTPVQQTVDAFVNNRVGPFVCDMLPISHMEGVFKMGRITAPALMYVDPESITTSKIRMALSQTPRHFKITGNIDGVFETFWVFRNHERYRGMTATQLVKNYQDQMNSLKFGKPQPLTLVNT